MKNVVDDCMEELEKLVTFYPRWIPITAAAEFLHVKPEALRASIEQRNCPFGFCWKLGDRTAYKLPTFTFVCWYTKGACFSA